MAALKVGVRLRSQVDSTEVIVIRTADVVLHSGGHPMIESGVAVDSDPGDLLWLDSERADVALGKRYAEPSSGLEVLVTRAGQGRLVAGGVALTVKPAAALPSTD